MSKHKKTRLLILILLTLLVLVIMLFSILPDSRVDTMSAPLSVLLRPFEAFFSNVGERSGHFFQAVKSNGQLTEENNQLRKENLALRLKIKDNEQAAKAYEDLKQAFSLKDQFPERRFLAANILQRPFEADYDYFRLDVGSADGLDFQDRPGYAVVDENAHLFGSVIRADAISCKSLPFYHEGFSCSAQLENRSGAGFEVQGKGYDQATGDYLFMAVRIPPETNISEGDRVYTSGRGGIFPKGVLCGEVTEVFPPDSLGFRQALLKAACEPEDLNVLFILLPRERDGLESESQDAAQAE